MKVAIVHDYLIEAGGAERVVEVLHEMYPDAPVFTSVYDPRTTRAGFKEMRVKTSFLQYLPHSRRTYKWLLPLYPVAFEQFDFSGFDVVISHGTGFSKGIITGPETLHVNFCHTPSRFAWRYHDYVRRERVGRVQRVLLTMLVHRLRTWDYAAAQRVDYFISNSANVARRVRKYYGRDSEVMYAPIDAPYFAPDDPGVSAAANDSDYFLMVSRLVPYKRIDLAVQAFNRLGQTSDSPLKLKVVGTGADLARLCKLAGPNVEFLGRQSDDAVRHLYQRSRGVLVTAEEDQGLVPLEANASGRPVIAFKAGGALETVIEDSTGTLFETQSVESLLDAIARFDPRAYDPRRMRRHAEQFDKVQFKLVLDSFVRERLAWQRVANSQHGPASHSGAPVFVGPRLQPAGSRGGGDSRVPAAAG